ncbi:MAG: hypothetical protein MZU95_03095 [Desulfomicrobium escambiense]|nr:hypothetical protein [Desulfomicrobium escambiense]
MPIRLDVAVNGTLADFGQLSGKNLVTGGDGRASATYTAPLAAGGPGRQPDGRPDPGDARRDRLLECHVALGVDPARAARHHPPAQRNAGAVVHLCAERAAGPGGRHLRRVAEHRQRRAHRALPLELRRRID